MNKYFETVTNSRGDSLANYRLQVVTSAGAAVDIFSDNSGTRFTDGEGNVVNYAVTGPAGKVEFYWTAAEGQILQALDVNGNLVDATTDFANNFVLENLNGSLPQSSVTDLEDNLAAKAEAADLASTDAAKGAALVGVSTGETAQDRFDLLGGFYDIGDLGTGVNQNIDRLVESTVTASNAARATDVKWTHRIDGAGDVTEVRSFELGQQHYFDGDIVLNYGLLGYSRLGLNGSYTVNATAMVGIDYHVAHEGSGTVGFAACFQAGDVDFRGTGNETGTATFNRIYGFHSKNLQGQGADQGRVTDEVAGFRADDISEGATLTAGFLSDITSGDKWSILSRQGGAVGINGKMRLGDVSVKPTDALEVVGFVKISEDGTRDNPGGYHELYSTRADFTAKVLNKHPSTPLGLDIWFKAAAPNNTSQIFLRCRDTVGERMMVWANGNVVNSNNSYGALSDARLKEGITDARPQTDDLMALRFRNYRLKGSDTEHLGIIAQEAMEVSPGLVSEGEVDGETRYQVNYSLLYLKTAKALQEAIARIDALEAAIND